MSNNTNELTIDGAKAIALESIKSFKTAHKTILTRSMAMGDAVIIYRDMLIKNTVNGINTKAKAMDRIAEEAGVGSSTLYVGIQLAEGRAKIKEAKCNGVEEARAYLRDHKATVKHNKELDDDNQLTVAEYLELVEKEAKAKADAKAKRDAVKAEEAKAKALESASDMTDEEAQDNAEDIGVDAESEKALLNLKDNADEIAMRLWVNLDRNLTELDDDTYHDVMTLLIDYATDAVATIDARSEAK
jgi:hypothetical protein